MRILVVSMLTLVPLLSDEWTFAESVSPKEAIETQVANDLNAICGDTFCGGDFDFYGFQFLCREQSCELEVTMAYYYGTERSPEDFYLRPISENFGLLPDQTGAWAMGNPRLKDSIHGPVQDFAVKLACKLATFNQSDLLNGDYTALYDGVYEAILPCVRSAELTLGEFLRGQGLHIGARLRTARD